MGTYPGSNLLKSGSNPSILGSILMNFNLFQSFSIFQSLQFGQNDPFLTPSRVSDGWPISCVPASGHLLLISPNMPVNQHKGSQDGSQAGPLRLADQGLDLDRFGV